MSKVTGQVLLGTLATDFKPTGTLRLNMAHFLQVHGHTVTAGHCARVAGEAKRLAARFGADTTAAENAGYLHDISAMIPNEERIAAAHAFAISVLPEEETFPMIIHQKLGSSMKSVSCQRPRWTALVLNSHFRLMSGNFL